MQDSIDIQPELPTQPSPPERGRAWRIVAIVLTLHAALLGSVVLIQGCSKSDTTVKNEAANTTPPVPESAAPAPDASTQAQNTTALPNSDVLTPEEHVAPISPESTEPSLTPTTPALAPTLPKPDIRPETTSEKTGTPAGVAATPPPSTNEKSALAPIKYVVKKGDTLAKIAKRNNVALADLATANKLQKNAALKIGQKLMLPVKGTATLAEKTPAAAEKAATAVASNNVQKTHVVKSGESPSSIARLYGISVQALMKVNHISDPRKVRVNQKLLIPDAKVAGTQPPIKHGQDLRPTAVEEPVDRGVEVQKL